MSVRTYLSTRFLRYTAPRLGALLFLGGLVFVLPNTSAKHCPVAHAQAGSCQGTSSGFIPLGTSAFDKDATIDSDNPTTTSGNATTITVANNDTFPGLNGANEQYGLVHFSTNTIAASAAYVILTIPITGPSHTSTTWIPRARALAAAPDAQTTITLAPLATAFDETNVTWNSAPAEVPNSSYRRATSLNSPILETSSDYLVTFDVTQYVKDVQAGSIQNNGFVLKAITTDSRERGNAYTITFPARENLNTPDYPRIIVGQPAPGTGPTPPAIFPTPTPTPSSTPPPSPSPSPSGTASPLPSLIPSPNPSFSGGPAPSSSPTPVPSTVLPPLGP